MTTKLVVCIGFSGVWIPGFGYDPERAATELRQAGYEVSRPPDADADPPGHPLDDYFLAIIEGEDDPKIIEAVRQEVEAIVAPYGGDIHEWGVL